MERSAVSEPRLVQSDPQPKSGFPDVAADITGRFDVAIYWAKKLVGRGGKAVGTHALCVYSTRQRSDDIFRAGTVVPQA